MIIEIGSTVTGTVVKIVDYGAIVRLAGGKMGLVHISEVAGAYVRDVRDYLNENDKIYVKVIKLNSKGRYELSVKRADASIRQTPTATKEVTEVPRSVVSERPVRVEREEPVRLPLTFEDKVSKFLKDSQERQLDIRRNVDAKRGVRRK